MVVPSQMPSARITSTTPTLIMMSGPRLTGTLSYLTGKLGMSKSNVEELVEDVFGAPIATGTIANLEQATTQGVAAAVA